jgi:DNA-binding SARP family transcriptional activator
MGPSIADPARTKRERRGDLGTFARMRITLCGRVSIAAPPSEAITLTRSQVQLCLAVLVAERHRGIEREELSDILWPAAMPEHWQGALRGVITKLRRSFERAGIQDPIERAGSRLQLRVIDVVVDVEDAARQVRAAGAALDAGDTHTAEARAAAAAELVAATYLPRVDVPWANSHRAEVEHLRQRARRLLARCRLELGRPASAADILHQLLSDDPFDDESQLLLARTFAAEGDRLRAISSLDTYASALQADLGVGPGAEHLALRRELANAHAEETSDASPVAEAADSPARTTARLYGRDDEHDLLVRSVLDRGPSDATESTGVRIVVVDGEPGVGKTALVDSVAARVDHAGNLVLWGSCNPHGTAPYQPVTEALVGAIGDARWAPAVDAVRPRIAALLGDGVDTERPAAVRPALFGAAGEALRRLASEPTLWVVEDAQWATDDTLELLKHLVNTATDVSVTLVLTRRHSTPSLSLALEDLGRSVPVQEVHLGGLDASAIEAWLADADEPLVRWGPRVHERTGGNPLFVQHLVDAMQRGAIDAPDDLPLALRSVLDDRVASVSGDAELVLSVAAVHGSPVPTSVVETISGLDESALAAALEQLTRRGLVVRRGPDRLSISHDLVETAALERLDEHKRFWLHRRVATVLESSGPSRPAAAEIARHHLAAGDVDGEDARRWSIEAARQALAIAAWASSAHHADDALAVSPIVEDRIEALLILARARRGLGEHEGAEDALAQVVELARAHRLPRALAAAVLQLTGGGGRGVPDDARFQKVELVEEALRALDADGDDDLRIPLLGARTVALLLTDRVQDRHASADEALRRARRHGDPTLVAETLVDRRFGLHPAALERRIASTDEALALAEANDRPDVAVAALVYRMEDRLRSGDRGGARVDEERARELLLGHTDPYWSWALATWNVLHLVLDGDLDAAEAASVAALESAADRADAAACFGVNLVSIRMLQGRGAEVVDLLDAAARQNPAVPCYRAVLSFVLASDGQATRAADELQAFVVDGMLEVPLDTNHLLTLAMLAETSVRLGEPAHATLLGAELAPYAGQHVVLNCYGGGGAVWGPVSAHLAALAELRGDVHGARHWYETARAEAARIGDRPFTARLAAATTP